MTTEMRNREDIVLVHPDENTLMDAAEARLRREKTVSRLRLLWERRRFLWKVSLSGLAAALVVAYLIPVRYESTAQLMPPDQPSAGAGLVSALSGITGGGEGGGGGLGSLAGIAGDVLGLKTSSDLFIGILQSRTIQDDLINKFNLRKVYWDRHVEDARRDLTRHTGVSADRKSGIITITVTDHSPQRAAAMTREYIEQLDSLLIVLNTSAAHRERVFLENRLKQVSQDLEDSEKRFSEFSSKNMTLDMKDQSRAMVEAAATLEGQLIAAQTEVESVKQIYSDNNVRVRSVQARVDELRRQIQRVGGKTGVSADEAGENVDSLYPTLRRLPLLGREYADLYRETRVQEAIFEMLTRQYEMAKLEEAKELPSVKVLDEPDISGKRSFPPRLLIVGMGTFLALSCGVILIFASELWKATDPQDPRKLLASEVWVQMKAQSSLILGNGSGSENDGGEGKNAGKPDLE